MSLELQFDSALEYQIDAISSVVNLFEGLATGNETFPVSYQNPQQSVLETSLGIGNKLDINPALMLANLHKVQEQNGLPMSGTLSVNPYPQFEIDMETGTGKTYVFLRSIFELNKKYGFTKFVVVVPSLAIKEGIYHSLKITKNHFADLYNNQVYDYFVYNSSKLNQVRDFAASNHISIMIINIQAFNRSFSGKDTRTKANIIHRPNDHLSGQTPIGLIAETSPIVIIDEPQSVDNTSTAKNAIAALNPLCCFRYSATHLSKNNLIYELNAIDAHRLKLVKQIEVTSFDEADNFEDAYIRLLEVRSGKSGISARAEFNKKRTNGISLSVRLVKVGDDLCELSGGLESYKGYVISEINAAKGLVHFSMKSDILSLEKPVGGIEEATFKTLQIEATIRAHLEKERRLHGSGIKVLSLFFLDTVANYRIYNEDGSYQKGKCALEFEKLYSRIIAEPRYSTLFKDVDIGTTAQKVHHGYFSADRTGKKKDQFIETKTGNADQDDYAYELIMKDKEKLLSFDSSLKFIFSHSALREGWDNPNVFQICTLNDSYSPVKKRQEIGRGLRLAVNQSGERQQGFDINTLTVIANESYESFCRALQHEYEDEAGIRFGIIEPHTFANLEYSSPSGAIIRLGFESSGALFAYFVDKGYISSDGAINDKLRTALASNLLEILPNLEFARSQIEERCLLVMKGLQIKKSRDRIVISLNNATFKSEGFKQLWDNIKYKTKFQVNMDSEKLTDESVRALSASLKETKRKIRQVTAVVNKAKGGISAQSVRTDGEFHAQKVALGSLPNLVAELQLLTSLKRDTITDILINSGSLEFSLENPMVYVREVGRIINRTKQSLMTKGTTYYKIGNSSFYNQSLFETRELSAYAGDSLVESQKSIYSHISCDSTIEKNFAEKLEAETCIETYVKLPAWFKIPTPAGNYNPDWGIVAINEAGERLFFIVETKGSTDQSLLKPIESGKIAGGIAHFKALSEAINFITAVDSNELISAIIGKVRPELF